uniref:RRM domain-containing protein n=1 Tax=Sphenodon punctatus TaxID=8508 RepID=A0A8D0L6Q0_SPHPU
DVTSKRTPKRTGKGRKPEEEGVEDNELEENSRDGQEDIDASLDNLQDIDMMDGVLDEAEIDNGSAVDCRDDYSADNILDSFSDSKDNIHAEMKELPDQITENEDIEETGNKLDAASQDLTLPKVNLQFTDKILGILGETCNSEPLKEDTSEAEQPCAQEASSAGPGRKLAEEEDTLAAQSEEDALDAESKSTQALSKKEAKHLVVAKGERSEQTLEEEKLDSESLSVENMSDQSSKASQGVEASSGETADTDTGAESKASQEDGKKSEEKANSEDSPATKESSTNEGGDQKKSSVEGDKDTKVVSKEEKGNSSSGRNFWVSGLSSTTRATDLKNLFSKYGKVIGAKVVTNARSPGARCYGFVTMSTSEETAKCITHCHKTEIHGKIISVEKAKNEPSGKKALDKKENEMKSEPSVGDRAASVKKDEETDEKEDGNKTKEKDEKDEKGKDDLKSASSDQSKASKSGSKGTERIVVMDKSKGEPVISVKTSSTSKDRVSIISLDKGLSILLSSTRERRERQQRMQAIWEREERERLERARERLEIERERLERERMERERLERERMHIEHERRREQERIQREREELRRQHEQPYDVDGRRDDSYWPEAKRMALDDRHRSDFTRQERFHDFDHRDRSRYQDHPVERREGSRATIGERVAQHYPDERHGGAERHSRDSRDSWSGYGSERRVSEGRGVPAPDGRDWGEHSRKFEGHQDHSWQGNVDGGIISRDRERWQGGGRGRRGHVMQRGGVSG